MVLSQVFTQPAAPTARRPAPTQYHGTPTALHSYYNNNRSQRNIFIRDPHPLSRAETWTLPNMERKTSQKATTPIPTFSGSGRDALKNKTLSSQKHSTKPNPPIAPGKGDKAGTLLQESTSKVVQLFHRTLPAVPHILSSARQQRGDRFPPDDSPHPLFKREEFSALQYMTLMDCGERETLQIRPGWELEESGISPTSAGEKSSGTPNGQGDTKKPEFKRKIKFGDYAKVGKIVTTRATNVTAMVHQLPPKPSSVKGGPFIVTKNETVKATDEDGKNVSGGQDGVADADKTGVAEPKIESAPLQPQAKSHLTSVMASQKYSEANGDSTFPEGFKPAKNDSRPGVPASSNSPTPAANTQSKVTPNGTDRKAQNPADPSSPKTTSNPKRPLPDNEISPPAKKAKVSANGPSAKRPLAEDESSSQATKKAKLSNGVHSKDPKQSPRSSTPASKSSRANTKKEDALKSMQSVGSESSGKKAASTESGVSEQSEPVPATTPKPIFPPLLSPTLPAQVNAAYGLGETSVSKSSVGKMTSNPIAPKSPKSNPEGSSMAETGAVHSKSHLGIPPLLSPDLPPKVEAALAARNAKSAAAKDVSSSEKQIGTPKRTMGTVADRHEKSRQPNAPGIARKVVKNGKNRPENNATSSRATDSTSQTGETSKEQTSSLVVKLKYKKKQKKDIERILKLRADPAAYDHMSNETSSKTAAEIHRSKVGDRPSNKDERRNSQDRPRVSERNTTSKRPVPSSSTAQKRPRPDEPQQADNKRLKPSDHPQASKPATPKSPAFKSPAVSAPPSAQKVITHTPKKSDALKGTVMATVNSTDGNARTPQFSQASMPGSAEKSAIPARNGNSEQREKQGDLPVKLKREMDRLHQIKHGGLESVSLADRKLGLVVGLECSLAYMASFDATDKSLATKRLPYNDKQWDELLKLHNHIDYAVRDVPILEVLSLQIKILSRFRMNRAFASVRFKDVDLAVATQNTLVQEQLWRELDHKMSDEFVQTIEESTSGTKKGFNPCSNFKQFVATSLRKLRRYADMESLKWEQRLEMDS